MMNSPVAMKPVRCLVAVALLLLLCLSVGPTLADPAPICWYYKKRYVLLCGGFIGAPEHKFVPFGDCAINPPDYKLNLESSIPLDGRQDVGCAYFPGQVPLSDNTGNLTFGAHFSFNVTKNSESGSAGFAFVLGNDLQYCGDDAVGYGGFGANLDSMAVVFKHSPNPCVAITSAGEPVGENCELVPASNLLPNNTFSYDEVMYAAVLYAGPEKRFLVYLAPIKRLLKERFLVLNVTSDITPKPKVQVGFTGGTTAHCQLTDCVHSQPQKILSLHFTGGRF